MDIEAILKRVEAAEPRRESVRIPLDPAALDRLEELEEAVKAARRREASGQVGITDESPVAVAQAKLDAYRAEVEDTAVTFTFRELKRPEWNALIRACPTKDPRLRWDEDLFEPALVAAACVDPPMDVDQAMLLFGSLGNTGSAILWVTAYRLQEVGRVPFGGSGTGSTNDSDSNSTTAPPEVSPITSS
jgi:hypothetical protein